MALFVHLTPAANTVRLRRSGVRAAGRGHGGERGVYCFPLLPCYTLTHQWLRELAHDGDHRRFVAVHIRLDDAQPVTVGHHATRPRWVTAREAVRIVRALPDPHGWEVFVPRTVTVREIHRVRGVARGVGPHTTDAGDPSECPCRVRIAEPVLL
ncbi:hypothetical protein [Nocardiopsis lambiniae]|uniref:DUF385 domain-containing protein n=1 Tax=Nocardiopsis lambiniae TaxID=3075539 RepID=A0ABU2M988_9ACTN|nr:hypothetical protein [Nocardiopsis sp. DSM 44743]MDT0328811.1 hypothetical protein [Nocardiopsis sp. DSM 44743]